VRCLDDQWNCRELQPWEHKRLILLVDAGLVGMDGFKYCWPWQAKESWRVCHK